MNKLRQVEVIAEAAVKALRKLGLGGFEVSVKFYDHYDNQMWKALAAEAHGQYHYYRYDSIDALESDKGLSEEGQRSITIFLPSQYDKVLETADSTVTEHAAAIADIVK